MTSAAVVDRGFDVIDAGGGVAGCQSDRQQCGFDSRDVSRCLRLMRGSIPRRPFQTSNGNGKRPFPCAASDLNLGFRGGLLLPVLTSSAIALGAVFTTPALRDAVTGATPPETELVLPLSYVLLSPLSRLLD